MVTSSCEIATKMSFLSERTYVPVCFNFNETPMSARSTLITRGTLSTIVPRNFSITYTHRTIKWTHLSAERLTHTKVADELLARRRHVTQVGIGGVQVVAIEYVDDPNLPLYQRVISKHQANMYKIQFVWKTWSVVWHELSGGLCGVNPTKQLSQTNCKFVHLSYTFSGANELTSEEVNPALLLYKASCPWKSRLCQYSYREHWHTSATRQISTHAQTERTLLQYLHFVLW